MLIQLDSLWQARAPLPEIPLRSTNTDPPPGHPKGKLNGFTAPVAGPLSHLPSVQRNWRTSNTQLASSTGEVSHLGGKIPKHCALNTNASIPRPPRVCCFQQAGNTALDLPDENQQRFACTAPRKKHCPGSPQTGPGESRCSTDLIASASWDHRPGITTNTHQCSSISPPSRGRLASNHHRPKVDSVPHPQPI